MMATRSALAVVRCTREAFTRCLLKYKLDLNYNKNKTQAMLILVGEAAEAARLLTKAD